MLHQAEGQQVGVTAEICLGAREVLRLQRSISDVLSHLVRLPFWRAAMTYEQYISASSARLLNILTSLPDKSLFLRESPPSDVWYLRESESVLGTPRVFGGGGVTALEKFGARPPI